MSRAVKRLATPWRLKNGLHTLREQLPEMNQSLLLELQAEELPPKALSALSAAFTQGIVNGLGQQGLLDSESKVTPFATPRRLAVHISQVSAKAADKLIQIKLMPVSVGLDTQGNATPALLKKMQALEMDTQQLSQLEQKMDGKAMALFVAQTQAGVTIEQGLQVALDHSISHLPIPKLMTYQLQEGCAMPGWDSVSFVRPVHHLVALFGEQVLAVKALGLKLEMIGCDMKALAKGNINAVLSVKSPIEGYIEEQYLAIGKYVTPADILVQIVGTLDKHVELKVFERDLSKLKLGQTILVESEGIRAKAKIFLIGQQVNLETRTTSVHGHFEKISDEKLFTVGQFISAKITVGSKSVSAVPQAALARVGKAGFIYFESSNGTIKQIPVEILSSTKDLVGIKPLVSLPEGKLVISGASALEAIFAKD